MLTLNKFEEASEKVKEVTLETKLIYSEFLSEQTGNKVYLKPENMQLTGAYKVRGAYYKISTLTEEERGKGLITASAGNHAQGVAYAAKRYGCKAVIVMPTGTPLIKINRTKSYGAEVILHGDVYDEACAHALELAEKHGYTFIHPFDDLAVATGQGSIAMEIFKELPLVEYILVPIGGGGAHSSLIGGDPAGRLSFFTDRIELSEVEFRGGIGIRVVAVIFFPDTCGVRRRVIDRGGLVLALCRALGDLNKYLHEVGHTVAVRVEICLHIDTEAKDLALRIGSFRIGISGHLLRHTLLEMGEAVVPGR
jgi:hypothetical protein